MGRTARSPWADVVISLALPARDDGEVQLIRSSHAARPPLGAVLVGLVVGGFLLAGGLFLAWVAFATPVLTGLTATPARPNPAQLALGAAIWGFTLVAPASFAIVGALRLGRVARAVTAKPTDRAMTRVAKAIGNEYTAASDVRLPDGRVIRDLILGPFGLAVIHELPHPKAMRHSGLSWEVRQGDGRWVHFENPLERAARDAERVRRWAAATDRDYVVKVFAAVVTSDPTVVRTATCSVVTPSQIPAWLTSLPAARALTADRQAELIEQIQAIV